MMKKNKGIVKKCWTIGDLNKNRRIDFYPVWEIKVDQEKIGLENPIASDKDIECRFVEVSMQGDKGERIDLKFNYLDLFMFIYYIANEELRQQLNSRMERNITMVPYGVTFKLSKDEIESGVAKRRIELEVDEIAMTMAKARADYFAGRGVDPVKWLANWKSKKKNNNLIV